MASTTMKAGLLFLAIALGAVATPLPAQAASHAASASVQRARQHFLIGKHAFEKGDYAAAFKEFEAGHAIEPRPGFLLNMAHAARRMGDLRLAKTLYAKFLVTDPPAVERRAATKAVAEIDGELAAEPPVSLVPASAAAPPVEPMSPPPVAPVAVHAVALVEEGPPVAAADPPPAARAPRSLPAAIPTFSSEPDAAPSPRTVAHASPRSPFDLAPSRAPIEPAPALAARARRSDEASPPIYRRWWLLAGAGIVVAGVAAAILIGSLGSGASARDRGTWGQLKL